MGAGEILRFLEKEKIATIREIADGIGIGVCAVSQSIVRMENIDVEKFIKINENKGKGRGTYVWKIKGEKVPENKLKKYVKNE